MDRIRRKVSEHPRSFNTAPWEKVRDQLNQQLSGWKAYFKLGNRYRAYRVLDEHVGERVRHFLRRRHKVSTPGTGQLTQAVIYESLAVFRFLKRRSHAGN